MKEFSCKAIAILTVVFFASNGAFVPASFADLNELTPSAASQTAATLTLEQANAQIATTQNTIPSGVAIQPTNPLSASTNLSSDSKSQTAGLIFNVHQGESIQFAIDQAQAGDTVYLDAGNYYEQVVLKQGVNLKGEDAATTTLHGDYSQSASVIRALGDNIVENLTVTGARGESSGAIKIEGDHVTVRDNKILLNLSAGVYVSANVADVLVEGNLFRENSVAVREPKSGNVIRYNTITGYETAPVPRITSIRYLANQGFQLGMAYSEGIYSYRIQYSDDGGQTWKSAQVQVSPGVFVDQIVLANRSGTTSWIDDGSMTSPGPLDIDSRCYRAVVAESFRSRIGIQVLGGQAPVIRNNIIAHQAVQSMWEETATPSTGNAVVERNILFHNAEAGDVSGQHLPPAISPKTGEGWTGGNLLADPQFRDPAHGDYRTLPGSPATWHGAFLAEWTRAASNPDYAFDIQEDGAFKKLIVLNLNSGQPVEVLDLPAGAGYPRFQDIVDVSPDGSTVIYGTLQSASDSTVFVQRLGDLALKFSASGILQSISFIPNSNNVRLNFQDGKSILLILPASAAKPPQILEERKPNGVTSYFNATNGALERVAILETGASDALASVSIVPSVIIQAPSLANQWTLKFNQAMRGVRYEIQFRTGLASGNWQSADSFVADHYGEFSWQDPAGKRGDTVYFRVVPKEMTTAADLLEQINLLYFDPAFGLVESTHEYPLEGWASRHITQPSNFGFYAYLLATIAAGDLVTSTISKAEAIRRLDVLMTHLLADQPTLGFKGLFPWLSYTGTDWVRMQNDPYGQQVSFEDNTNFTNALAVAYGALLDETLTSDATVHGAGGILEKIDTFIENQKVGYLAMYNTGSNTFSQTMQIPSGALSGTVATFGAESSAPLLFLTLQYGDTFPASAYAKLNFSTRTYTMQDLTTREVVAPFSGAFQMYWPALVMPESENPDLRGMLETYTDVQLDYANRNSQPGLLSAAYDVGPENLLNRTVSAFSWAGDIVTATREGSSFHVTSATDAGIGVAFTDGSKFTFEGSTMQFRYSSMTAVPNARIEFKQRINGVLTTVYTEQLTLENTGGAERTVSFTPPVSGLLGDLAEVVFATSGGGALNITLHSFDTERIAYNFPLGINEIALISTVETTPSVYNLGAAYMFRPAGVEALLQGLIAGHKELVSSHGLWEGENMSSGKVVNEQVFNNMTTFILGMNGTGPSYMTRYLENKGLTAELESIWNSQTPVSVTGHSTVSNFEWDVYKGTSWKLNESVRASDRQIRITYQSDTPITGAKFDLKYSGSGSEPVYSVLFNLPATGGVPGEVTLTIPENFLYWYIAEMVVVFPAAKGFPSATISRIVLAPEGVVMPPEVIVNAGTPALINVKTLTVNYTVDGVAKTKLFEGLAEGVNTLAITAADVPGLPAPVTWNVTVDTIAPVVVLDPGTPSLIHATSLTISYTADGVAKQQTFTGLVEGANTLAITEADLAGNQTIVNWNVTVDTSVANGFLTYNGSYTDATLQYPGAVAISPDAHYVYVGDSNTAGSITWFAEDAATGALTYAGRYTNASIDIPQSIILSSDGKYLYATSSGGGAVSWFTRNVMTGALTYGGRCQDSNLSQVRFLTMSPDGNHVYAVSEYDNSVAWLIRNQTTGQLTYGGKYQSNVDILGSYSATVSGDGKNVYVLIQANKTIVWLTRNTSTGALTYGGKYQSDNIKGASSAVVSTDGSYVYVAGDYAKAVAWFSRNQSTGALTYLNSCLVGSRDQYGIESITLSPDGSHLFVSLKNDNAVAWLTRNASTGALTYNGMYANSTNLKYAGALAVSPDGSFVYASAGGSRTINWFQWGDPAHFEITTTGERSTLISGVNMTVTASTPYSPVTAYQWYLDGVALSGQTQNVITLGQNLAVRANAYELKVGVTLSGVTDFKIISFTVKDSFVITLTGVQANPEQDSNMIVSAATDYGANESYQWYLDGVALAGETSARLVIGKGLQGRPEPYELTVRVTIGNVTVPQSVNFTVINRPYLDITGARALPYAMTCNSHTGVFSNAGPNLKVGWQASYIENRGFVQFNLADFYSLGILSSQITKIEFITDYVSGSGSFSIYDMKTRETGSYHLNSLDFYPSTTLLRSIPAAEYQKGIQMDVTSAILADIVAGRGWSGLLLAAPSYQGYPNVIFSPNAHLRIYVNTTPTTIAFTGFQSQINLGTNMTVTAATTPSPVSAYQWYLDGNVLAGQTNSAITIGSGLSSGRHFLALTVVRNGLTSSKGAWFLVQAVAMKNSSAVSLSAVQPDLEQTTSRFQAAIRSLADTPFYALFQRLDPSQKEDLPQEIRSASAIMNTAIQDNVRQAGKKKPSVLPLQKSWNESLRKLNGILQKSEITGNYRASVMAFEQMTILFKEICTKLLF